MPEDQGATNPPNANNSESKRPKSKPKKILPTDRIAFSKQIDLLRAYAAASGPSGKVVTNLDVAEIVKMHPNTISLSNAFFLDVGFLQRADTGFIPAQEVMNFNLGYQWNPQTASHKLAPLVETTWFAGALLPRLAFRNIDENEAIAVLAEVASADPDYKNQIRTLLNFLEAAGLITWDGTQIRANQPQQATLDKQSPMAERDPSLPKSSSVTTMFTQPMEGMIQFHVAVKVNMAEFSGWQPDRIAAFFAGVAQVLAAKGAVEKESADK